MRAGAQRAGVHVDKALGRHVSELLGHVERLARQLEPLGAQQAAASDATHPQPWAHLLEFLLLASAARDTVSAGRSKEPSGTNCKGIPLADP